jgi:hypothetical protein
MNTENNTGYGYMIVRVTTARGAIPLEGATVTVQNYDPEFEKGRGDVIAVYTTGDSGLTEKFSLPAPSGALSMSPGNGKSYESYILTVTKGGYYRQEYVNVPVFEGITAIQNVDMIPLPENGVTDRFDPRSDVVLEMENPFLESTKKED